MSATASPRASRVFAIDKAHSEVVFQVRHLITKVRGRFSDFDGHVRFDDTNPSASSITLTLQAASIDTNQPDRDAHLRSADFFHVDQHPSLSFVSTNVVALGGDRYDVTGDLTIRGVTHAITVPVSYVGVATDPWGNTRAGFEGETTINRKDFGLTWNAALEAGGFLVGDDVRISVSLQAIAQPA